MDFFERWLHVAPDGGSGVLEAVYAALIAAAAGAVVLRRRIASFARNTVMAMFSPRR